VELERSLPGFRAQGLGVAAISYDSPEVLRYFSRRMGGFHFPLLSDEGSTIIKAFGIFNHNIPEGHEWYGICFPGTFIVDENGIVLAKYFEDLHRQRYTTDSILVREFGVGGGKRVEAKTDHLALKAYSADDVVSRGNRVTLVVEVDLPAKMHVYAPGVMGYRPVSLEIADDPMLLAHDTDFPEPEMLHLEAIGETVPVYEGHFRLLKDVTISPRLRTETVTIPVTFSYQACDDEICYIPTRVPFSLELRLVPHDGERVPEELRKKGKSEGH
jgi:AhpC/TSA family/Thiol:disulfide interchange protein DsbD, N-terminal